MKQQTMTMKEMRVTNMMKMMSKMIQTVMLINHRVAKTRMNIAMKNMRAPMAMQTNPTRRTALQLQPNSQAKQATLKNTVNRTKVQTRNKASRVTPQRATMAAARARVTVDGLIYYNKMMKYISN